MTAQGCALRSAWLRAPPQSRRAIFSMCYGPEFVAKAVQAWIAAVG
jgi:putative transposase